MEHPLTSHDLLMILVMTFPMFIFTIIPAIKLADYLEKKYYISETQKRVIMLGGTFFISLLLSIFLNFY
jgi:predicted neutral ceramidase superfamily lipid hydrolase